MPSKPTPLADFIRSLLRGRSSYALLIPAVLTGCGGGGGGGSDEDATAQPDAEPSTALGTSEAASVMAQRLSDVQNDQAVQVGFSPLVTLTCNNLGTYSVSGQSRTVCQIYDEDGTEGVPHRSPDGVDLVSRVPAGDASAVLAEVDADLQGAAWAPVLQSEALDFGNFNLGTLITGQFMVQGGDASLIGGSCALVDTEGQTDATATLANTATDGRIATLSFSDASGFGLLEGTYRIDCTFTEGEAGNAVEGAGSLQVLYNNTAPTPPAGVTLVDEASLLTDPDGKIRDVNGSDFCVAFTERGTDAEDALLGNPVTTEGFYEAGGVDNGPVDLAGQSSYCIDISEAGGQDVNAGFKSQDSEGAYSDLAAVLRSIDANEAPSETAPGDFDGTGGYSCNEGDCTFPTLTGPSYEDPEGDAVTTTYYQDGEAVGSGSSYTPSDLSEGTYTLTAKAEDAYGQASATSASYAITVGAPNTAPSYASGSFPGSYSCTEGSCSFPTLEVTACSDAEGDSTTAKIYRASTQMTEGELPLAYTPSGLSAGTYSFYGACVDEQGAEGDESLAFAITIHAASDGAEDDDSGSGAGCI